MANIQLSINRNWKQKEKKFKNRMSAEASNSLEKKFCRKGNKSTNACASQKSTRCSKKKGVLVWAVVQQDLTP